jgi:outer membrane autotransporter protein
VVLGASGGTISTNSGATLTVSGVVSGVGALTKTGAGVLTLSGVNTYSGMTTVSQGTLAVGSSSALGTGDLTLNGGTLRNTATLSTPKNVILGASGGTFLTDTATTLTLSGVVAGAGALIKTGTGTLVLTGTNANTGATTVSQGTLRAGAANALSSGSAVILANTAGATLNLNNFNQTIAGLSGGGASGGSVTLGSATLTVNNAANGSYAGVISGTGGLTKIGAGTLTLSGANTYSGATTINGGTVAVSANSNLGTGVLALNGGTLENTTSFASAKAVSLGASGGTFLTDPSTTLTLSGVLSGAGSLAKSGSGTLVLSGANTFTGAITVNAGTLQVGAANAISSGAAIILANTAGATLNLNNINQTIAGLSGGGASGGNVTLGSATLTVNNATNASYGGVISGTGGMTKSGSGALTLTGNNAYTGATAVNAGTLRAGAANILATTSGVIMANTAGATLDLNGLNQTIASLSGGGASGGNVALGTAILTVNNAANVSYGGVISGTGALAKSGAGTLTLSGANTYSGGARINAGTLAVSTDSNLGTGALTLSGGTLENKLSFSSAKAVTLGASGGTFLTDATTTLGLSGVISGVGGLSKSGAGTLILSGANTYTGATQISAGTLTAGAANALSAGSVVSLANTVGITLSLNNFNQTIGGLSGGGASGGNVTLGSATLTVQNVTDTSYGGVISGTGGLIKAGAGTLTLSGMNAYTGTTTITGGTLSVSAGSNLGSGDLALNGGALENTATFSTAKNVVLGASGGTFLTDAGTTLTVSGAVSGTGALIKSGAGALTLSGAETYSGQTLVTAGTLNITGALASQSYNIYSGASLTFSDAFSLTGTLKNNGTVTVSNLSLLSGSILSGAGTVIGNVTNNSGTVSPGNSPGTLTVVGNYVQNPGSTLSMEITPSAYDQLVVTGTTTINGGTLNISIASGYYSNGQTYALIRSQGGITGAFDTVTINNMSPFLVFTASQDSIATYSATFIRIPYTIAATNRNSYGAALGLTAAALGNSPAMSQVITALDFSPAGTASPALTQLSAEPYSALGETAFATLRLFSGTIRDRLYALRTDGDTPLAETASINGGMLDMATGMNGNAPSAERTSGLFLKPVGQVQTYKRNTNRTGFDASTVGFVAGGDAKLNDNVVLGAQVGYAHTDLSFFDAVGIRGDADTLTGGIYGSFFKGGFHADALVQAGFAANRLHRKIAFSNITRNPSGKYTSFAFGSSLATGYDFSFGNFKIGPVATLDYGVVSNPAFTESGAYDLGLKVRSGSADSLKSGLGFKVSAKFALSDTLGFSPDVSVRWGHEFLDNSQNLTATFNGAPISRFTSKTGKPSRNDLLLDVGVTLSIKRRAKLFVRYSGEFFGEKTRTQAGAVGFRYEF